MFPRQFLTTPVDVCKTQRSTKPLRKYVAVEEDELKQARDRRCCLKDLLASAAARWSVSEAFATVYRESGGRYSGNGELLAADAHGCGLCVKAG